MKRFFAYEDGWGVTWHDTVDKAKAEAQENYEDRVKMNEGIPDMNLGFCWGEVKERIAESKGEYKLVPIEEITDTDRLNLLLDFITVDDVGDDRLVWGPVVQGESLEKIVCNQAFANNAKQESIQAKDGWERRCILAAIDEVIRKEKENDN